jgi:transcriptional activator SPT8
MQFKIIPGHHGGMVSQMRESHEELRRDDLICPAVVDPAGRFLISASGNRGWHGEATRTVFVHDIKPIV